MSQSVTTRISELLPRNSKRNVAKQQPHDTSTPRNGYALEKGKERYLEERLQRGVNEGCRELIARFMYPIRTR